MNIWMDQQLNMYIYIQNTTGKIILFFTDHFNITRFWNSNSKHQINRKKNFKRNNIPCKYMNTHIKGRVSIIYSEQSAVPNSDLKTISEQVHRHSLPHNSHSKKPYFLHFLLFLISSPQSSQCQSISMEAPNKTLSLSNFSLQHWYSFILLLLPCHRLVDR